MSTEYAIRSMFHAPAGKVLLQADFSQAETWVVAGLADETRMLDALMNSDIHTQTAMILFDMLFEQAKAKEPRYVGKRYNHASSYRMSYQRAAEVINADSDKPPYITVSLAESKRFSERWHGFYNVKGWWSDIEAQLRTNRTITTPYGRTRRFFAAWNNELLKEATAFVPQSTVADHVYGKVQDELGITGGLLGVSELPMVQSGDCQLVNTAHDSVMLEVPTSLVSETSAAMKKELQRPLVVGKHTLTIPVDFEVGERWGEMEKLKVA